jgi:hypothetical protein
MSYKSSVSPKRINSVSELKFKACGQSQNSFWEFKTRGSVGRTVRLFAGDSMGGSFKLVPQSAERTTIWGGGGESARRLCDSYGLIANHKCGAVPRGHCGASECTR